MSILAVGSSRLQRFASTLASSRGRQGLAVRVEAAAAGAVEEGSVTTKQERKDERSVIVIDNYDSFTYNLCQVNPPSPFLVECRTRQSSD